MDYSIIIARILGVYLLIMFTGLLLRRDVMQANLGRMLKDRACLSMGGIFTLILGLILVVTHNHWAWDRWVVITIVSWWILIKGVLLFWAPECVDKMAKVFKNHRYYLIALAIGLLLGAYLLCLGFW